MSLNIGVRAEISVEKLLCRRGLQLIARNVRSHFGEIDLVMREHETLVFVEVRFRANVRFGTAAETVLPAKQRRIQRTAQQFLLRFSATPRCRFDIVSVEGPAASAKVRWLRNAFMLESPRWH